MLAGENSQEVTRRIEKKVEEINSSQLLPDGLKIVPFYKRTDIVNASVRTIAEALLIGALLVVLILFIFLRSFRQLSGHRPGSAFNCFSDLRRHETSRTDR